jgi:major membrane immunogen (membrane-anchored lipoprotein)
VNPRPTTSTVRRLAGATVTFALISLGACSSDDASEGFVENLIEQNAGEDIDIDIDDGDIRVATSDGTFEMDTDDDGNVEIRSDEGDVLLNTGEDGRTVISSDEGTMVFGGSEIPENFPSEVPIPGGMTVDNTSSMSDDGGAQTFSLGGTVVGEATAFVETYVSALQAAGFTEQSRTTTSNGSFFTYAGPAWTVNGIVSDDATGAYAQISVFPAGS